jgi:trehalose-6-phosphate synthase
MMSVYLQNGIIESHVICQFSGAAQSLGAGAILVNPWNIREMYIAIEDALNMPETESKERHKHNFSHVTNHTAQAWADTFVRWGHLGSHGAQPLYKKTLLFVALSLLFSLVLQIHR